MSFVYQYMYMHNQITFVLHVYICSFLPDTSVDPTIELFNQFKIEPSQSPLSPGDKAKPVSITFLAKKEVTIQNLSILKCQVSTSHGCHIHTGGLVTK